MIDWLKGFFSGSNVHTEGYKIDVAVKEEVPVEEEVVMTPEEVIGQPVRELCRLIEQETSDLLSLTWFDEYSNDELDELMKKPVSTRFCIDSYRRSFYIVDKITDLRFDLSWYGDLGHPDTEYWGKLGASVFTQEELKKIAESAKGFGDAGDVIKKTVFDLKKSRKRQHMCDLYGVSND